MNDSRWIAFASKIRTSHGNFCECCKRGNVTTNVHHLFYDDSKKPWEYDEADMMVLCRACHGELHAHLKSFRKYVFAHLTPPQFRVLNGALKIGLTSNNPLEFVYAVAELAASPGSVKRFANAWNGSQKSKLTEQS